MLQLKSQLALFQPLLKPVETKIEELKGKALDYLQEKFNDAFDFDELLVLPKMVFGTGFSEKLRHVF